MHISIYPPDTQISCFNRYMFYWQWICEHGIIVYTNFENQCCPDFALQITSRNYKNESRYLEIIGNISYKQMRGKLASAIQYLSGEDLADENIFPFLTRQDIADFASITIESAIKFLKEFEKEKIIKLDGKNIEIIDPKSLNIISKNG